MKLKTVGTILVGVLLVVMMFNLHQWLGYRFDKDIQTARVMEHVKHLTDVKTMGDKSMGKAGNQEAAKYIATEFEKLGLQKLNGAATYYQVDQNGQNNVVAILPGPEGKDAESQVFVAHFDASSGKTAEQTISDSTGIATLLETAAVLTQGKEGRIQPKKTLIFLAVNGHYENNSGMKYFVENCGYFIPKMKVLVLGDLGRNNEEPLPVSIVQNDVFGTMMLDRFAICAGDIGTATLRSTLNTGEVTVLSQKHIVAAQVSSGGAEKPALAMKDLSEKRFKDVLRAIMRFIDQTAL